MLEKEKKLFEHITDQGERIRAKKRVTRDKDETIGFKEKEIYELKKKNQELEKFKFVLDYRIKELKKQIEPREREITEMKDKIKKIDSELEKYHSSNARLDSKIGDLRQELDDCQAKISKNAGILARSTQVVKSFQSKLHRAIQHVQNPAKLDAAMIDLRNAFVKHDVETKVTDKAVSAEFERQRQYLENTVTVLKSKSQALSDFNSKQNQKLMQENMELIADIKDLRQSIKNIRLTPLFDATPPGQSSSPAADGPVAPDRIRQLEEQAHEIAFLRKRIAETEQRQRSGGLVSRGRLPPMDGVDQVPTDNQIHVSEAALEIQPDDATAGQLPDRV